MAIDGDDLVSLPSSPPPRPMARRAAIDAALRKFDGGEDAPAEARRRSTPIRWATLHRRPAGALAAAVVVAILGIPAIQIALRENPSPTAEEKMTPEPVAPSGGSGGCVGQQCADRLPPAPAIAPFESADVAADRSMPRPARRSESSPAAVESLAATADREEKTRTVAAPATIASAESQLLSAPPPPAPPPPPPAEPEQEAFSDDNIVVTGSLVGRRNLESPSAIAVVDAQRQSQAHGEFLSRLQAGLRNNDRPSLMRLVGLPLRVNFGGERRTYRSLQDVERDFDRIFTPAIRQAALSLGPDTLKSRDGGRLKGNSRLWFGCGKKSCPSDSLIRIRELSP